MQKALLGSFVYVGPLPCAASLCRTNCGELMPANSIKQQSKNGILFSQVTPYLEPPVWGQGAQKPRFCLRYRAPAHTRVAYLPTAAQRPEYARHPHGLWQSWSWQLIQERARVAEIFAAAVEGGMRALKMGGIEKIMMGLTSIKMVRSVCIK